MEGLTWANVISLLVAMLALGGTAFSAVLLRRSARDKTTADLTVNSVNARVEAEKVQLTDKQYQAQREQMATEITAKMGEMYNRLLTDANATLDRLTAEVKALTAEVGGLKAEVADCERRSGALRVRLARVEVRARAQGWELE